MTRLQFLIDHAFTCEMCGGHAEEVHHEIELTQDNIRDPAVALNPKLLHALCGDCHKLITKRQKHMRRPDCDPGFVFDSDGNLSPQGG